MTNTPSASIIVEQKEGVVKIPSSAVKTQGDISYVEVLDPELVKNAQNAAAGIPSINPPAIKTVVTGISNDTEVEIIAGLDEGEAVVTRTIAAGTAITTTGSAQGGQQNVFRAIGGGSPGGGGRIR